MALKVLPGKYWIADPCYLLNEKRYDELTEKYHNDNELVYEEESRDGKLICYAFPTAHGDGEYPVYKSLYKCLVNPLTDIINLPVDSGLISITSFDLATETKEYDERVGFIVEVLETIDVWTDGETITFGTLFVDTNPKDDDEEENDGWANRDNDEDDDYGDCRDYYF